MGRSIPISVVQPVLSELVAKMIPGETVTITEQGKTVAVITKPTEDTWPCEPGSAKDRTLWMAPDFDESLEDFAEYMP